LFDSDGAGTVAGIAGHRGCYRHSVMRGERARRGLLSGLSGNIGRCLRTRPTTHRVVRVG
jgi:hypothetical protein